MEKAEDPPIFHGLAWAALGENDKAFEAFRRPEGFRSGWATTALRYWFPGALSSIRKDSRYESLIQEINRSWGLKSDGQLPNSGDLLTQVSRQHSSRP